MIYDIDNPYLIANPAVRDQFSARLIAEYGGVGIHTAEGAMDDVGPDTGAENVASFISTRTGAGSYSCIGDSDSTVVMIPDNLAAYHVAAADKWGTNLRHGTWSYSFATRADQWGRNPTWDARAIRLGGRQVGDYLLRLQLRDGVDPSRSLRWLDHDQTLARQPGLWLHGVAQPGDRSDAWVRSPMRSAYELRLLDEISNRIYPEPSPPTPPPLSLAAAYIGADL